MCTDWLKLITINDPITASMIDKKVLTKAYSLLQFNDSGVSKQNAVKKSAQCFLE